jgi:putative ABC transport system substrate-binding protein
MMDRRAFIGVLGGGLPCAMGSAKAQPLTGVYRIGIVSGQELAVVNPLLDVFRSGMRELGYAEPNLVLDVRLAQGQAEDLPRLVGELVGLNVDVILTASSTPAALAAKRATSSIPIVAVAVGEPVLTGLVPSLARPGGNVTGSTVLGAEVAPKRLELAKELRPTATRIALLGNPDNPAIVQLERALKRAAPAQGLTLLSVGARSVSELDTAFSAIQKLRPDALLVTGDGVHQAHIGRVIAFAARSRIPALYNIKPNALAGGLLAYAPDDREMYRRAAEYVDKILRGAKPGELPFQQATKFELVLNLRTAKTLGLTIPQSLLLRADQVIE